MGAGAAVGAAAGAVGSWFGANAQADAAKDAAKQNRKASDAAIAAQMEMYNQARSDYEPYRDLGERAIGGYQQQMSSRGSSDTLTALNSYKNYQGQSLPGANLSLSGMPNSKISMNQNAYYVPTESAKVDPTKYNDINTKQYYVDPTQHQADASDVLDFKINQNDPVYQWKMGQAKKNALTSLAGAGLSGSKYGMSMQNDAAMGVMSDEADKQYSRAMDKYGIKYQQSSDLYNRTADQQNLQYGRDYTKESDLYNRTAEQNAADWQRQFTQKDALYNRMYTEQSDNYNRAYQNEMANYQVQSDNYNRAFQNASYTDNLKMNQALNTFNMGNALDNQQYSKYLDAIKIGAGAAGSSGQWAMNAGQNAGTIYSNMGQSNAAATIAAGNAMGNFYSGLGALPANAMSMYYGMQ